MADLTVFGGRLFKAMVNLNGVDEIHFVFCARATEPPSENTVRKSDPHATTASFAGGGPAFSAEL